MIRPSCRSIVAALAFLAATASASYAETIKITADLKGASETPPNESKGTGSLSGTYDPATKTLTWAVTYSGLTGPATMAHFHAPAPVGKAAGVEVPVKGPVSSPIEGSATLTPVEAKNLTDGLTYFNVHTQKNPKGELRGQVLVGK